MGPKRGTSVYRGVSWDKARERWLVQTPCHTIGRYIDEVEAALAYDAAAIALGETDGLNFPGKVSEVKITDALLLKLFKTTDRDRVEEMVEQHQKENGNAMSEEWKALLKRKMDPMSEAISTNGFKTAEEAAKAVDRLSYKIGRLSSINFPLSEEERAELDSISMEELIASSRQACRRVSQPVRGTSVYRKTDGLNFPERESEAKITDALLLKLFKTTDRDKVEEIIEQHQNEHGKAMIKKLKALLKRKMNPMSEDPEFTSRKVGRKRKKPAPRGLKKKANMSESSEGETEEESEEELPMHNGDNVDNGVNDGNEEAIQENQGTDDVLGRGPAAASSHQGGPVPWKSRRRRERRGGRMTGEEDADPPQDFHVGSRDHVGVGDPLVIGDQLQQMLYTGGLLASADLQSAVVVKQEIGCLEEVVGALPGLLFPAQASMFPAQSHPLSSHELALFLPTSMDTQLDPSLLDTMAFESISGWIPLDVGESVTEGEPHAQPPHSQPPHAQLPHTGGLLASADLQSALLLKPEPDCLEQDVGAHPGLVFPAQACMFPALAPALSSQELALLLPTGMDTQLGPSMLDMMAFESISGWIPLEGGERLIEDEPHAQPPCPQPPPPQLPHAQLPLPQLPYHQLPQDQLPQGLIKTDPDSGLLGWITFE